MMMKLLRIIVAEVTAVTLAVFAVVFFQEKVLTDKTIPVITVEEGVLEVKSGASDEELLAGVTAYDEKDGDLTDRVLVESIGKFSEIGYCKVTYAVGDSDHHVVTAQRQIHYTDYQPPTFYLRRALLFSIYNDVNVIGAVGAKDCLDGDISGNVIIYSPDFETGKEGLYTLQATVQNSKGDTAEIVLPMVVDRLTRNGPQINLKEYLIYVKKGTKPDWNSYVTSTADSTGIEAPLTIRTETDYNADKPGTYTVDYYGTDSLQSVGRTRLIVIVK
ncbi:MAG: hypothetical protein IJK64_03295 [Clostridia bacterium]|nr:hypothetical protein [Clostridia bacterium]